MSDTDFKDAEYHSECSLKLDGMLVLSMRTMKVCFGFCFWLIATAYERKNITSRTICRGLKAIILETKGFQANLEVKCLAISVSEMQYGTAYGMDMNGEGFLRCSFLLGT